MEPVVLRVQETAKLLGISTWTVYRWIEEGRLRATKIGRGSLRVFRTSVTGLIAEAEDQESNVWKLSPGDAGRTRDTAQNKKK